MIEMFGSSGLTKLRNESFLNRAETRFTEKEIKFLQDFYYIKGVKACASALKRTKYSVTLKAGRLMRQGYEFKKLEKKNGLEDYKKAQIYLGWYLKECEEEKNGSTKEI